MATFTSTGAVNQSITRTGRFEPFELQVSRDQISFHSVLNLFGFSTSLGSTAYGPLWEGLTGSGGNYVYPASAVVMTLANHRLPIERKAEA